MESLSAYARQFLGRMEKPDVDYIEGLSPAISIDQKGVGKNPRSTMGTITEIYDYLRLLFARVGHPHCPKCGREITSQNRRTDCLTHQKPAGRQAYPGYVPLITKTAKVNIQAVFDDLRKQGYVRVVSIKNL